MKMNKWVSAASALLLGATPLVASFVGGVESASAQETLIVSAAGQFDYVSENIKAFEEANNVKVEVWDKDMFEVLDGLSLDGPAGTGPDVMIAPYDRVGSLGATGMLLPVTLNDEAEYDDTDKQQVTFDGEIYAAPATIETLVMFYNTDLLEKAPETFEELEGLLKDDKYAFEGEDGKNVGFLANWVDFYHTYGLLAGYGGYVFGEDGTNPEELGLNNDGAVEAIEYATKFYQESWPQGMQDKTSAPDFLNQSFMDGKTAAVITGPWMANDFNNSGVKYAAAKIPTLPNGEDYKPFGGGKGWTISAFTEKQELAQKFIDWVTSTEQQDIMYERLEEVPANQVSRKKAAESGSELTAAVIDVYKNAVPMPNIPQMAEVWTGAENMMFDAVSGSKSAKETADAAVELIKEAIAQKGY
ncbi:extracellular solute-binding protein [Eremococcus coleocola]|uniref:Maltodextrin-binding protein n=1 Tax=Eremococcus coleocola ACS-139-V-Col8 TaxID=908337 RepID=E4KNC1_9LACT|nr:extracellular solute-binding protein [Eremococcus coleocola]EFR31556.1 maltodextrin-binding protein MdxE [Eremococcus coleocola ACS-139-V-Col8]